MIVLYVFFDTIHGVQSGIIRGLGLQVYGALWTLICYYPIGLTLALCFAFNREMGVYGLWLGFVIAVIVLDIGLLAICECPDWGKIAAEMQKDIDETQKKKIEDASEHLSNEDYASTSVARTPEARRFIRSRTQNIISKKKNELELITKSRDCSDLEGNDK